MVLETRVYRDRFTENGASGEKPKGQQATQCAVEASSRSSRRRRATEFIFGEEQFIH